MRSEGVTIGLAAGLPFIGLYGIGHMYCGKVGRGAMFLLGGIALEVVAILGWFLVVPLLAIIAYYIWVIFDAAKCCRMCNEQLQPRIRPAQSQCPNCQLPPSMSHPSPQTLTHPVE
jgi:hypothetical protein